MNEIIIQSILEKRLLKLDYDGGTRTVEPHCFGITTAGNPGLRAYQVSGYSKTKRQGWKMFDLSNATNIYISDERFKSPRKGYVKGDKGMAQIFAQL